MTEDGSPPKSDDFGARLKKARETRDSQVAARNPKLRTETSGYGQAFRIGTELVSGLIVGVGIGWFLDNWLGTKPWMMVIFIFLGGGAGISNVYRAALQMTAETGDAAQNGSGTTPKPDSDANKHEN